MTSSTATIASKWVSSWRGRRPRMSRTVKVWLRSAVSVTALLLFSLEAEAACAFYWLPRSAPGSQPSKYYVCAAIAEAPTGENGYLAYDLGTDKFYVWGTSAWNDISGTGGGAPTTAPYWVAAPVSELSAEVDLSVLTTGLVINTGGTPSAYTGTSCTNQFPRSLSASGAATCASVDLANDTGSALPLAKLADDATSGLCLVSGGTGGDPSYTTCPGGGGGLSYAQVAAAALAGF